MAYPYIVLEFQNGVVPGDTVTMNANGMPFTFEAVSGNSGFVPGQFVINSMGLANESAASFSQNAALSLNSNIYNITYQGNTVTIQSLIENAANNFGSIVSSTSSIVLINQVDEDGTIVVDIDVSKAEIEITYFKHENAGFTNTPFLSDVLIGNIGDKVSTTIRFTTAEAVSFFQFQYGLINNNTQVYSGNSYAISNSYFNSLQTLQRQSFSGGEGYMPAKAPYTWFGDPYESLLLTNLGGNDWELVHTYLITPFLKAENISGLSFDYPDDFAGSNSVKYIFKIIGKDDLINTVPTVSTDNVDLSNYIGEGNVGYLDEFLNTGIGYYNLTQFQFLTDTGTINSWKPTIGLGHIKSVLGTPFSPSNKLVCFIQEIKEEIDVTKNLIQNYNIDRVEFRADNVSVNGSILKNVSAQIGNSNPDELQFIFEVDKQNIIGNYAIWLAVTNDDNTLRSQNVLCQIETTFIEGDDEDIKMETYPGSTRKEFNFNYHYNNDISNSFNQVRSFVEDRLVARWRIENQDLSSNSLVSFKIQIKDTESGIVYDERNVTPFSIPTEGNRDFKLEPTDPKNEVSIIETSPGVFDFVYGFQIWETMRSPVGVHSSGYIYGFSQTIVFSCVCVFLQTAGDQSTEVTKEFQSPFFELGNYRDTKSTGLEPIVLPKTPFLEFWQEANYPFLPVNGIIKGNNTRVRATFEAYVNQTLPNESEMVGYLGINSSGFNQNSYEQFSSIVANGLARPWEQITGEVNYNALVTKVDFKTVQIEAVVVWDELKAVFPGVEEFCVSARIDYNQANELFFILRTNRDPGIDGNFTGTSNSTFDIEYVFVNGSAINANSPTNLIDTGGNGLDGTAQNVKLIIDDLSSITSLEFADANIIENVNISSLSGIQDIRLQSNAIDSLELPSGASINNFLLFENSGNLTTIDLSNTDLSGIVNVNADFTLPFTKLTSLIFPSNSNVFTQIFGIDNNLSSLDLSGLTGLGGSVQFSRNSNLSSLSLPVSSQVFSSLQFDDCNIAGQVDASGLSSLGGNVKFQNNGALSGFLFPTSTENISSMFFSDCDLTGNADLSGMTGLGGIIQFQRNSNLTSLTLPTSNNTITSFAFQQCDITGILDLSTLNGLSGSIRLEQNVNMTNVLFPSNSLPINNLYINDCGLSSILDLSGLSGLGGTIQLQRNSITGINWPTSTNPTTNLSISQNSITGSMDMSGMVLGGTFRANINSNLSEIIHGSSTQSLTYYNIGDCNITGVHVLSPLTNLGGSIIVQSNDSLTGLTLPIISQIVTLFDGSECDLGVIDWSKFTGTNNNISISLDDNGMSQSDVDDNLADLVATGWTNGTINISGNNSAPSAAGLASVVALEVALWAVTVSS